MIEDQIFEEIKKANSILLHLHPSPDCDSQGSAMAMYFALTGLGKKVTVIKGDSDLDSKMAHLPGADKITTKNFLEIDQKDFDLFIVQDATIDRVTAKGPITFAPHLTVINIDHHASNKGEAKINLIDPSAPATALILFRLFKKWGIEITNAIARNLLVGIYTDTGNLTFESVNKETLLAVAELREFAPEFTVDLYKVHMMSRGTLRYLSLAYRKIEAVGSFAIVAISLKELQDENINVEDVSAALISGILRNVEGFDASVCLLEDEPERVKCSFRSNDIEIYDVSKIAGSLGGGGHRAAAGVLIKAPFEQARERVLSAINQYTN